VVARATAVRNWSESAARWAVWLWPVVVCVVFCEVLLSPNYKAETADDDRSRPTTD
jgi:hypothetical protein